jgi:hypothetical protein
MKAAEVIALVDDQFAEIRKQLNATTNRTTSDPTGQDPGKYYGSLFSSRPDAPPYQGAGKGRLGSPWRFPVRPLRAANFLVSIC